MFNGFKDASAAMLRAIDRLMSEAGEAEPRLNLELVCDADNDSGVAANRNRRQDKRLLVSRWSLLSKKIGRNKQRYMRCSTSAAMGDVSEDIMFMLQYPKPLVNTNPPTI
jgi:hypothetical protein